ncbi:MAG: sigma 54-interacting transcriptional regulator [Ignavibacteriales bacterium]|nr:sigma 54-interacting transcriptional regulator [Ignavibacteriales bacterium]
MNKKIFIKILITFVIVTILFVFQTIPYNIDTFLFSNFNRISGEKQPDTSIVIIHINSQDIEQLGPWPLKRSYYALLINNLSKYGVKKIGLEVFLSSKFVSQAVYDNVLQREISKANNVVISSIAGNLKRENDVYTTDSLSFPSPKLINEQIPTGHLNYFQDGGIEIPLQILNQNKIEKAFCLSLLSEQTEYPNKIKVNFISSWNKFTNYSLVEFIQMLQSNSEMLLRLRDKIILIGISDPQLAASFTTTFDEQLPGVALHAFALDNLLNKRYIIDSYYNWSKYLLILIAFLFVIFQLNSKKFLSHNVILIFFSLLITFMFYRLFFIEIAYSFLLIPLVFVLASDIYFYIIEKKNQLAGFYDESELLKNLLTEKERKLSTLERELNYASEQKTGKLLEKIEGLKGDIDKLKENENDQKEAELSEINNSENFLGLIYRSTKMKNVVDLVKKSAPTDATILITGESGTGKELVAKALHTLSNRKDKKFIAINCAALTESLLESELFGHVRGAFTGAISDKEGKFESANKGTIFLDEIGETSENFQVKLLRVLQSGEYDKVGSVDVAITDVRVISATNKDLKQLIKEKKFREDLYYRLNVININLPALRERKEDIETIAAYFCESSDKKYKLSLAVLKSFNEYDWPGNVRELESAISRAKVFCDASNRNLIQLNDLPVEMVKSARLNFEDLVIESLRNKYFSHSSINETAKELGNVSRTLVAENFRGLSLKILCENNFNEQKAILSIAASNNEEVLVRVKSKLDTWLVNIRKDVEVNRNFSFDELKLKLNSKYKNLPQKYHKYLDEVIKHFLNQI